MYSMCTLYAIYIKQQIKNHQRRLTHPRGEADQLHKCIAAASSARGVFDGNVKVEREAQQTDARQLSRNLLLVPKVSVLVYM